MDKDKMRKQAIDWWEKEAQQEFEAQINKILASGVVESEDDIFIVCKAAIANTADAFRPLSSSTRKMVDNIRKL